jgi:hypothetical protein
MPATPLLDEPVLDDEPAAGAFEADDELELLLEPQPAMATSAARASAMRAPRRTAIFVSLMRSVPS